MNVKKIIIYAMFTVIILITSGCSKDNIEYTKSDKKEEKGIEINEKNFPSEYVRELVSQSFDSNNDNQLTQNEIDAVTELRIDPDDTYTYMDGLDNSNYKYSVIDCRGLEIFKNVEKIRICVEIVEHNDEIIEEYGLLNFEKLYELDKVKELFISGEKYKAKYELNRSKAMMFEDLVLQSIKYVGDTITLTVPDYLPESQRWVVGIVYWDNDKDYDLSNRKKISITEPGKYSYSGINLLYNIGIEVKPKESDSFTSYVEVTCHKPLSLERLDKPEVSFNNMHTNFEWVQGQGYKDYTKDYQFEENDIELNW